MVTHVKMSTIKEAPADAAPEATIITVQTLNQHNTKDDCWIAVHSKVWDITHFINEHPGGSGGKSRAPLMG